MFPSPWHPPPDLPCACGMSRPFLSFTDGFVIVSWRAFPWIVLIASFWHLIGS